MAIQVTPALQLQILGFLLQMEGSLAKHRNKFTDDFFEGHIVNKLAQLSLNHYDKYSGPPSKLTLTSLLEVHLVDEESESKYYDDYVAAINGIYEPISESDQTYIVEHMAEMLHGHHMQASLFEAVELSANKQYQEAAEAVAKGAAFTLDGATNDFICLGSYDYEDLITQFTGVPISTGFTNLDDEMHGGLRPGEFGIICGPPGSGKCFAEGTKILKYDGTTELVENIKSGDILIGPDSKPRKVTGTTEGIGNMYKVTPVKGDPYTVNDAHILSLKYNMDYKETDIEISVSDFLNKSRAFKSRVKGWKVGVDIWEESEVPIDPYLFGVWLGDGTTTHMNITTPEPEIENYMRTIADSYGYSISYYKSKGLAKSISIVNSKGKDNVITNALRSMHVCHNKHIPHIYKANSVEVRSKLLAGILDSDGWYSPGGYFEVTQKSKTLTEDIAWLARSLGFSATYTGSIKECCNNGVYGYYYRLSICGDISTIPTIVHRKKARVNVGRNNVLRTSISVDYVGIDEYYGFKVDGDGLFLLGDFTVTHNSEFLHNFAAGALIHGKSFLYVTLELGTVQIVQRIAACLTNMDYWKIAQNEADNNSLQMAMSAIRAEYPIIDKCHVLHRNNGEITAVELKALIMSKYGNDMPDLILIDYADLLKFTTNYGSMYEDCGAVFASIFNLAKSLNVPVWSATQANREGSKVKFLDLQHMSDSFKKAFVADTVYTICRDDIEKEARLVRLYSAKQRSHQGQNTFFFRTKFEVGKIVIADKEEFDAIKIDAPSKIKAISVNLKSMLGASGFKKTPSHLAMPTPGEIQ